MRESSRGAVMLFLSLWTGMLCACSPIYIGRAAWEEAKFLWRRESIEGQLDDPALDVSRRQKLERVLAVRRFAAEDLALSVGGAYGTVSEVDGSALVHVVTAARRDRLERYTWWFPIVGRVPYKGFFSRTSAEQLAASLEAGGYDTYRRTATAFSTLGWFDDPIPSTLLDRSDLALTNTILHELFHATVFVKGHVDFNESAATFMGHQGAIQFYCEHLKDLSSCEQARRQWEDARTISRFLTRALDKLGKFYESEPLPAELEAGRRSIFAAIRRCFSELDLHGGRYADDEIPLNNATLLHDRLYFRGLDIFDALYVQNQEDLRTTVEGLREIASERDPFESLERQFSELLEFPDSDSSRPKEHANIEGDDC